MPAALRRIVVLLVSATLLLGACTDDGGDSENEPELNTVAADKFMEEVCTSLSDWLSEFLAGYQQVTGLDPDASVQQVKRTLEDFLDNAVASTEELIGAIEEAGLPDVSGGEDFASRLSASLEQATVALGDARAQMAELPDDPTRFRKAARELGDTVRAQLAAAGEAIGQLGPDLSTVAQNTPSCQSLGGAVGGSSP